MANDEIVIVRSYDFEKWMDFSLSTVMIMKSGKVK